ncbi:MAG: hypothetical protein LBL13_02800 [Bacteroidales bacterium]|jgi:hypothetical protein|nr:hypothetical protein [Bacteroidales bacterium]
MKKLLYVIVVCCLYTSCKKEKEKDYRDAWCGYYDLTMTEYKGVGPLGGLFMTTFSPGDVYYDKSKPEDELILKINDGGGKKIVFKLTDKEGNFVETKDGENYEKGYITSGGVLFYEKQIVGTRSFSKYTIDGKYNDSPVEFN